MDRGGWYRTPSRGGSRWFEVGWGGRRFSDPLTRWFEACCCGGSDGTRLRLRLPRCLAMAMRSATAAAVDRTPPAAAPPLYAREEHEQPAAVPRSPRLVGPAEQHRPCPSGELHTVTVNVHW